jgi:mediator of DNA damage checkpoint protein 1
MMTHLADIGTLGVHKACSISDATHFVADSFYRTRNMLEAIALGKPVVTSMWLENCGGADFYIDEKKFILRGVKKEKEIGFSMSVSLASACKHPLLLV